MLRASAKPSWPPWSFERLPGFLARPTMVGIGIDEDRTCDGDNWARWLVPGRTLARQGLRSSWSSASRVDLQYGEDRSSARARGGSLVGSQGRVGGPRPPFRAPLRRHGGWIA